MIENQKSPSNSCKYCGWEFQNDIIQKIIEQQESVVCEFCGIEINISSINPQEGIIKENYERTSNSKDIVEKKKKSIVKSISKLTKTKKYSVNVILGDKDFPKIFKENLIVVISRLIYKYIREWEKVNDVNIRQVGLTQTILITLAKKVKPIIDKRIHNSKLANLHKITPEEFEEWLKLLQKKIHSTQEYRKHFLNYLLWLTKLVFRLVSDMWEKTNLPKFQATIIKDLKNFPLPTIEVPEVKTRQKLFNDGKRKECGRCHEIKSINEFEKYMRSRKTAYCKPCRLEYKQIRALQNKTNIIRNIYGGKYAEKCPECDTTIVKVPTFDFHHPIKELKTKRINFHGNWMNTLKKLEKEKAIPLCRNCHLKKQSKYYNKYKDLIEKKNDFESSISGIEKDLYFLIYQSYPHKGHKEGYQIKSWISKRIVIKRLYNGNCIGCGETNLAALQFHHRDITKKTFHKYDKLRYTTIKKIEKKLIQDDAVCLCGNCHRMIGAYYFEKNHQEIIGSKYFLEIGKFYEQLKENIKNFQFPASILKQYPLLKTEKIEIGGIPPKSYKLTLNEEQIKEEIKSINWEAISNNWKLPTGELLNPTKESSRTNPLYKHKKWLEYIYNNKKWRLSYKKIARITNISQTTIYYWRKKLEITKKEW